MEKGLKQLEKYTKQELIKLIHVYRQDIEDDAILTESLEREIDEMKVDIKGQEQMISESSQAYDAMEKKYIESVKQKEQEIIALHIEIELLKDNQKRLITTLTQYMEK